MKYITTIYRNEEPITLIVRASYTRNTDECRAFGTHEWDVDIDAVTDDQGRPVELTKEEEADVIDQSPAMRW